MPVYEYQGQHYDLSETDPAAAKAKIMSHLGESAPTAPKQGMLERGARELVGVGQTGAALAAGVAAPVIGQVAAIGSDILGQKPNESRLQSQMRGAQQGDVTANAVNEWVRRNIGQNPEAQRNLQAIGNVGQSIGELGRKVTGSDMPMSPLPELAGVTQGMSSVVAPRVNAAMGAGLSQVPKVVGKADELVGQGIGKIKEAGAPLAEKAISAMTPEIDPYKLQTFRKAHAMGIPVSPAMLTDNKMFQMINSIAENTPLSGSPLKQRQTLFNQKLIETIGGDSATKKLTPDIYDKTLDKWGSEIGNLSSKYDVPPSNKLKSGLAQITEDAGYETTDNARIIDKYVSQLSKLTSDAEAKGESINGEALRKLRTRLTTQMRSAKDGDLKQALGNINEVMLDSIESQMTPEDINKFREARSYYRNGMLVRDVVSPEGEVSPSALMNRMRATSQLKMDMARDRAGDLGDLANIGQLFLKESPTGLKGKLSGLSVPGFEAGVGVGIGSTLGVPGAVAAGAGMLGGANLYNRVVAPAITQKLLIPPP
jgi:hypothetical protein